MKKAAIKPRIVSKISKRPNTPSRSRTKGRCKTLPMTCSESSSMMAMPRSSSRTGVMVTVKLRVLNSEPTNFGATLT